MADPGVMFKLQCAIWWLREWQQQKADEREVDWNNRTSVARVRWARATVQAERADLTTDDLNLSRI